ncbi:cellulose synthase/poly-beta-1,6-N-acetylglucosamine synthase-like glycosyltransferase [Heliobacterium gestii]|nr:cellulose synthase/poly-beta-1,6-N-acetylglucosamine synthase-like glycosyltransferase [Heliomicrobium gestii]
MLTYHKSYGLIIGSILLIILNIATTRFQFISFFYMFYIFVFVIACLMAILAIVSTLNVPLPTMYKRVIQLIGVAIIVVILPWLRFLINAFDY